MNMDREKTIASIATAPGNGAIAIVRLSGKDAITIADKIFSKSVKKMISHRAYYGNILSSSKKTLDQVLLILEDLQAAWYC